MMGMPLCILSVAVLFIIRGYELTPTTIYTSNGHKLRFFKGLKF
jgi:hypothetical protein